MLTFIDGMHYNTPCLRR